MRSVGRTLAILAASAVLASGVASAQPALSPQGGGNYDMDHGKMGGPPAPRTGGPGPGLTPLSGNTGSDMDHSRMGGSGVAPSVPGQRPIDQGGQGPALSPSGEIRPGGSGGSSR